MNINDESKEHQGYLVYSPKSGAPYVVHSNMKVAYDEARRLATKNPNQRYYILQIKGHVTGRVDTLTRMYCD